MIFNSRKYSYNNDTALKSQPAITSKVLKAANSLIKAIIEESEIIKSGKLSKLKDFLQNKVDQHNMFYACHEELSNHALINGLDKNDKNLNLIKEAMHSLDVENKNNDILVKIAMEASERIVNVYKESQIKASIMRSGYNNEGKISGIKGSKKAIQVSSMNSNF